MTDTITLPSGVEVYQGPILVLPGASTILPVGDLTPAEVQALRDDVAASMNKALGDLTNVSEAGKVAGSSLVVLPDGTWAPGVPTGAIGQVNQNWGSFTYVSNVDEIAFTQGIAVEEDTGQPGRVRIVPQFGTSGTQYVAARADHQHPPTLKSRFTFDKNAAMLSAGESTLVNNYAGGLIPTVVYDVDITGRLEAVNSNSSGRLKLWTKIGGTGTPQSVSRGFSGGVWTEVAITGTRMSVSNVSSLQLQFWVEYESGDPTALYTGELSYRIDPRGGWS